jgi:predicted TIM-barrel fold metal-dependent hydrolase
MLYSNAKAKLSTADELLASMDDGGIKKAVIQNIGWVNNDLCIRSNDYILEMAAKYPDRLISFCSCQPAEGDAALREIERCAMSGARGIGELRPDIQGYELDDREGIRLLAKYAVTNNLIVSLHSSESVGHQYAGKGSVYPQVIYEFARRNPDLIIVAAHLGGGLPFYEMMPEVSDCLKSVYYDTAAIPFLYKTDVYRALIHMIGSRKILFGSDWPLLPFSRALRQIENAGLSTGDIDNICRINAMKLLDMDEA